MDFSRPTGNRVNGFIDVEHFPLSFCRVDDAVRLLTNAGGDAFMPKLDIQHAFRLIPVRPEFWNLQGFQNQVQNYFDTVLPFGSRSSPHLFCLFSDAVRWNVSKYANHPEILVYCDHFLIIAKLKRKCSDVLGHMAAICRDLACPSHPTKPWAPHRHSLFRELC